MRSFRESTSPTQSKLVQSMDVNQYIDETFGEDVEYTPDPPIPPNELPTTPIFNIVYLLFFVGLLLGVRVVYIILFNRHQRESDESIAMIPRERDGTTSVQLLGLRLPSSEGSNNRREIIVIQSADDVIFDIREANQDTRKQLVVISKTEPALLRSFNPSAEHDDMVCALCLEPLNIRQLSAYPCNHPMHENCFRNWVVKTTRLDCPICAQDYSSHEPGRSASHR